VAGPTWLRWVLVAGFLAVAGYCVVRLAAAHRVPGRYRGCHRALDVAHLIMGLGMAVMCSPIGGPLPAAAWQTAFVVIAAWFLGSFWHSRRTGSVAASIGWHGGSLHHALAALAMLYMLTGMPDAHHLSVAWMPAMPTPTSPLGWLLACYFLVYGVILTTRPRRPAAVASPMPTILTTPRIALPCQLIMTLGTGYLLLPIG
jgi:Domain of unknown function (DUF5134)